MALNMALLTLKGTFYTKKQFIRNINKLFTQ